MKSNRNFFQRLIDRIFQASYRKSSGLTWAENEVRLACSDEIKDPDGPGYGCAILHSALRAYKSLMDDDHSGYSIEFTRDVLNRLIEYKPLVPLTGEDSEWSNIRDRDDDEECNIYQNRRYSGLFKYVYDDGRVNYRDIHICTCVDVNSHASYTFGLVSDVVHEMYPIGFPYMPSTEPMKVYCEDLLTDEKNGDFDTVGVHHLIDVFGTKIPINRYFKEGENNKWDEIDVEEWGKRQAMHEKRLINASKPRQNDNLIAPEELYKADFISNH